MDRERLRQRLGQGLSLTQIGALEGRHASTVGYWVRRHGLEAGGRDRFSPKGELTAEQLRPLVARGMTLIEIAGEVDRSIATVRYWLRKHGLRTRGRRGRAPIAPAELVAEARAAGRRTLEAECPRHGLGTFVIERSGRARCRQCRMDRVAERRRAVKRILVEEAGGCCARCGYDRCIGALQFHHRDPTQKQFGLAHKGRAIALERLREEAAKCTLVCANCHAEIEHGTAADR
jgi:transposase